MTPDQIRHLQLVEAHLDKLLDLAAKRTTGKWMSRPSCGGPLISTSPESVLPIARTDVGEPFRLFEDAKANADFIAACAGNAEAGWVATKGMIMLCRSYDELSKTITTPLTLEATNIACDSLLETILIAWPLELLS